MLRHIGCRGELTRRIVLLQNEVDHACNGVGSIQRRRAVGQHLDALHGSQRDRFQVHRRAGVVRGKPTPIQQHKRVLGTDRVERRVRRAAAAAIDRLRRSQEALIRWQRLDDLRGGGEATLFDVFPLDHGHGQRCFRFDPLDRGARDLDTLKLLGVLRQSRRYRQSEGPAEGEHQACADLGFSEHVISCVKH